MSFKVRKNKGFTLVEILMTMIILSASLMGIFMLFSKGTMFIAEVQANNLVINMLEEQMELIRQTQFSTIITTPSSTFISAGFTQLSNPQGQILVDSPPEPVFPISRIVRVTVTITWDSPAGQSLTRSLVTYITDEGISS
ncbi:MAG: type II secretion system protein [Candidatus Omnitrophota bacterium]